MAQEKERLQFDFAPEALERLDKLKEKTGATTRAEAVRSALRAYEWIVNELSIGDTITVTNKDGELVTKLPARLLLK